MQLSLNYSCYTRLFFLFHFSTSRVKNLTARAGCLEKVVGKAEHSNGSNTTLGHVLGSSVVEWWWRGGGSSGGDDGLVAGWSWVAASWDWDTTGWRGNNAGWSHAAGWADGGGQADDWNASWGNGGVAWFWLDAVLLSTGFGVESLRMFG